MLSATARRRCGASHAISPPAAMSIHGSPRCVYHTNTTRPIDAAWRSSATATSHQSTAVNPSAAA
jgi:hypothetical protein